MTIKRIKKQCISILKINVAEEATLEFRLRKIEEARNYILDVINHNDLMCEKYKKTYKYLNYVENVLILVSTVNGCVLIFAFPSLVCVPVGTTSSRAGMKICTITAGIKKYKSIIKKKKKKYEKIMVLGKDKLNTIEVLISNALIDSYISYDEFDSVNDLREYNEMKNGIKNPETSVEYNI